MTDPWRVADLDLDRYVALVGVQAEEPSYAALARLHEAHQRTFPFENIDVLLQQHAGVSLEAVQDKFLKGGRGGYCFEHATLFAAVLERLGYQVTRFLGRVGEDAALAGRTHLVVVVELEGTRYLCDVGFGYTITRPIELRDGAEDDHRGRFSVRRLTLGATPAWELRRWREDDWELMHTTDELPIYPVDVVLGHHFTSTAPTSHFTKALMVGKVHADRHRVVTGDAVTTRVVGEPTAHRPLEPGELQPLMEGQGIRLSEAEWSQLKGLLTAN